RDARRRGGEGPRRRRRAVGEAVNVAASPEPTPFDPHAAAPPALEGDLSRFVAGDVMQFLRLAGASGKLECERHGERVDIVFAHGRPIWARAQMRAVRLGDVLVHRGWVDADALAASLAAQHEQPDRRLGTLLSERGVAL